MARDAELEEYDPYGATDQSDDGLDFDENDDDPVATYEQRVNTAKKDIKNKKFASDHDVVDFLHEFRDVGEQLAKADGNLLHALIDVVKHNPEDVKPQDVQLLAQRMVEKWQDLVKGVNKDGFNPILNAIRLGQHEIASFIISACKDGNCLNTALSTTDQKGMTCLHLAFKDNIDPATTRMLIEKASDDVLALQDHYGQTSMRM
jgi:hypothetical protein